MFWALFIGFLIGVATVLLVIYIIVCDPFGPKVDAPPFVDQFKPIEMPEQLRHFLKTGDDGVTSSSWESTFAITVLLHLLYQEHKDSRLLRRWLHKRLQLELNDIITRSAAGRLIQDIRIRDLSLGAKVPIINKIRVEKVEMSNDDSIFENAIFLIDLDYPGGFETSIDVQAMLGGYGSLSLKVSRLAGSLRLIISRKPFTHWAFSFESTPDFDFEVISQIQGHRLRHIVPLIRDQIRRALQRKHVWPNYKIRYRPLFPNPLLQPSPPSRGLEVTVLQCSRLKTSLTDKNLNFDVYCTVTLDHKPFLQNGHAATSHSISVLLTFTRFDTSGESGILFAKASRTSPNAIQISAVEAGSLADKAHFKKGDVIVAINSLPVRNERQVESLLRMKGDLAVLVERNLEENSENELLDGEELIGDNGRSLIKRNKLGKPSSANDQDVYNIPLKDLRSRSNSASTCSTRRHSMSILPASTSTTFNQDNTSLSQSAGSSTNDLSKFDSVLQDKPMNSLANVSRTESARVPHVLVSTPSIDLRRTRSESQIDNKQIAKAFRSLEPCSIEEMFDSSDQSLYQPQLSQSSLEGAESLNVSREEGEKGSTLKAGTLPMATSHSSLASSISLHSSNFEDSTHMGSTTRSETEKTQSRRARIHTALAAGKKRVFDLIPQKKRPSSMVIDNGESVELGLEAGELQMLSDGEKVSRTNSPTPTGSKLPAECTVKDQENESETAEKPKLGILGRRKKGSSHKLSTVSALLNPAIERQPSVVHTRSTRPIRLEPNVLWAQSLHFELNEKGSHQQRYLNLTVHAREKLDNVPSEVNQRDPAKPILLGYTSLYLPQILEDCRLTLSNCHREVFQLKSPNGQPDSPASNEFSKHPGFDPRLMFGDVTLNFRYFPDGLPKEARVGLDDSSEDEQHVVSGVSLLSSPKVEQSLPNTLRNDHDWKPWSAKQSTICSICKGKIWLKTGRCCSRCFIVCHQKCQGRETISCQPNMFTKNDDNFEDISNIVLPSSSNLDEAFVEEENEKHENIVTPTSRESKIPSLDQTKKPYQAETETVSRRTRFKAKMSEKIGQLPWRRRKEQPDDSTKKQGEAVKGEDLPSPMASITSCLYDLLPQLEGSPFLASIYFQPGNAYNEETIANAKRLGKEIFSNVPMPERQQLINEQIDRIQKAIHETKTGRLEAMSGLQSNENRNENAESFEGLDERLQALAVLMLHYCAALQDCCEQAENEPKDEAIQTQLTNQDADTSNEKESTSPA
ncbi:unnamed protein product, partial [Mesorhabditis belari]|uniref:PDZ domain-containing protein 8 n=1 Tax=Mesorhabditis belari TaxID=2138241 RepID=A0AAF3FCA3_9BILA